MAKIAFLGAGSVGFGRRLVMDIMSFPELAESTVYLIDPLRDRVEITYDAVCQLAAKHGLPTQFEVGTERAPALDGADYVITSLRVGKGMLLEAEDVQLPLDECELRQTVADTVGIGGVMKGLRTIPAILDIAREMEKRCPRAVLLNYTNPMAMIQWAVGLATSVRTVGLCHSVQHTCGLLAEYMDIPLEELAFHVGGINHMAWYTELRRGGEDVYPRLRACLDDADTVSRDPVRFDIMRHLGYFVTESSPHMAEYVPYFLKDASEVERLDLTLRTGESQHEDERSRQRQLRDARQAVTDSSVELERSHEYAAEIMRAMESDILCRFHGSVPNAGLIPNLPDDCCVEVPCYADVSGVHAGYFGPLPPQCAALCASNVHVQGLTARAVLEQSPELAVQAAMVDPNTTSQLSLSQIREVMEHLLANQAAHMPW